MAWQIKGQNGEEAGSPFVCCGKGERLDLETNAVCRGGGKQAGRSLSQMASVQMESDRKGRRQVFNSFCRLSR